LFFPSRPNRGACVGRPLQPNGTCVANVTASNNQATEINEHSAIFGLSSRLLNDDALRLSGDIELLSADNFFVRLDPRQSQHYRGRASYQAASWMELSVSANILEQRNRSAGIGYLGHYRNFSFDTLLGRSEKLGLDLGYDYSNTFSRANICFISNPLPAGTSVCPTDRALFQTVSFYDSKTHFGHMALQWKPLPALTTRLGTAVTSTGGNALFLNPLAPIGPLRSLYLQPTADMDLQLMKGLDWKLSWNYYTYNEDSLPGPTLPRNFHANVGTVGLRYSF